MNGWIFLGNLFLSSEIKYSKVSEEMSGAIWNNKVKAKFGRIFVWFASLDDLIKMKKAAGRPKDNEDLKFLRRLKQKKR